MPLGPDDFNRMREIHKSSETKEHIDQEVRFLSEILTLVLDASIREGKLWALRPALKNAIIKLIEDFTLGDDVRKLYLERWRSLQEELLRKWQTSERLFERWTIQELWSAGGPGGLFVLVNAELTEPERQYSRTRREEFFDQKKAKTPARKKGTKSPQP